MSRRPGGSCACGDFAVSNPDTILDCATALPLLCVCWLSKSFSRSALRNYYQEKGRSISKRQANC